MIVDFGAMSDRDLSVLMFILLDHKIKFTLNPDNGSSLIAEGPDLPITLALVDFQTRKERNCDD